ncbi:unnamed protein product [Urochloa humidicola]
MVCKDSCTYSTTSAIAVSKTLQNVHSCENWLPRRVMSAWCIAGMVHALEGWNKHECGDIVLDIFFFENAGEIVLDMEKVWSVALLHGLRPAAQV